MSLMLKATALLLIGLGAAHLARRARASVCHGILLATRCASASRIGWSTAQR